MSHTGTLTRFRSAQDRAHAGFADALRELRASHKQGHWIWYVFPQLLGLGSSPTALEYGLRGVEEAREYLEEPTLRDRLLTATRAVAEQLRRGVRLRELMGSEIDAMKLVSSLTLFEGVARRVPTPSSPDDAAVAWLMAEVLAESEKQGFARCSFTLERLARSRAEKIL